MRILKHAREDLQLVRDVAECEGDGDLEEQSHGGEGIALQRLEAEASDDGRAVGIETAEWAIVAKGDEDVHPEHPVAEL
jgi:hypothetical protein